MATLLMRRVVGAVSALLIALVSVAGFAGPAHAEEGYQYWNYFHLEKSRWAFSDVGVAEFQPKDGAVEGFRYGTSTTSQGIEPRADLGEVNFDTVCGDAEAAATEKRVAVVIDYGTETGHGTPPEPRAECAVLPQDASTADALGEVTQVRAEGGMTCALDGYPASGCGEPVKNADVPANEETVTFALPSDDTGQAAGADAQEDGSGPLWTVLGVALLVVLIAGGALALNRRSKAA